MQLFNGYIFNFLLKKWTFYLLIIMVTGLICAYTSFVDDRNKYNVSESLLLRYFLNIMHIFQGMIIGVWYGIWSPIIIFVHIIDLMIQ